jgi:hypothetical protein
VFPLQSVTDVWFLGVRNVMRMLGLRTGLGSEKRAKGDGGEITEHVTTRLTVCQGYIQTQGQCQNGNSTGMENDWSGAIVDTLGPSGCVFASLTSCPNKIIRNGD